MWMGVDRAMRVLSLEIFGLPEPQGGLLTLQRTATWGE
jgi:hypothetical protein